MTQSTFVPIGVCNIFFLSLSQVINVTLEEIKKDNISCALFILYYSNDDSISALLIKTTSIDTNYPIDHLHYALSLLLYIRHVHSKLPRLRILCLTVPVARLNQIIEVSFRNAPTNYTRSTFVERQPTYVSQIDP